MNYKITSLMLGFLISFFVLVYAQDTTSDNTSSSSEDTSEASAASVEGSVRPDGVPGNWVYRPDTQVWGPPSGSGGGGTISVPIDEVPPYVSPGTPSCPISGQTCNYDYIYDHSIVCGSGENTTYCTYGCENAGGTASNFGAYCRVPSPPSVYIFLRDY
jgi:hypothetical protein